MKTSLTISQRQAAHMLKLTRQRVGQLVQDGKLSTRPVQVIEHRIPIEDVEALRTARAKLAEDRAARKAAKASRGRQA